MQWVLILALPAAEPEARVDFPFSSRDALQGSVPHGSQAVQQEPDESLVEQVCSRAVLLALGGLQARVPRGSRAVLLARGGLQVLVPVAPQVLADGQSQVLRRAVPVGLPAGLALAEAQRPAELQVEQRADPDEARGASRRAPHFHAEPAGEQQWALGQAPCGQYSAVACRQR